jgi:hypothetical protein
VGRNYNIHGWPFGYGRRDRRSVGHRLRGLGFGGPVSYL